MRALLADLDIPLQGLADLGVFPEPDESGATYWENARIKALAYAAATGMVTVAEDSGLEMAALGGEPGVHSARYLGPDTPFAARFTEIFRRLADGDRPRDARFVTALAVVQGSEILFETEATVDGIVALAPDGANGFGYDPIFFYPPFSKTTAAMSDDDKQIVSHRGRAFRDLARWLRATGRIRADPKAGPPRRRTESR